MTAKYKITRKILCLAVMTLSILFTVPVMAGNYIFMGDSYSSEYYSWPEIIIEKLKIPAANVGYSKNAGAGFTKNVNSFYLNLDRKDNVSNHINTIYKKSREWNKGVKRIIIQGGVLNDYMKASGPPTQKQLYDSMKKLDTELKKRYPNAKILYASTNWCVPSIVKTRKPKALSAVAGTYLYAQYAKQLGWYHMRTAENSLRLSTANLPKYFKSDGIHPNAAGKKLVANAMVSDIKSFESELKNRALAEADKRKKISITKMNVLKVTETTITLNINSSPQGVKYILYGGKIGEKFKQIDTLYNTQTVRKNLRKGTYYNYQAVAYDSSGKQIAKSRILYVATKGGKYTNACEVKVPKTSISLKKGKTYKVIPSKVLRERDKTEKIYQEYVYISDTPGVAGVSDSGTITAKYPGTAKITVIAQSGASKTIQVVVS